MTLCDVRVGPTEDKLVFDIPSGIYRFHVDEDSNPRRVTLHSGTLEDARPGELIGRLSVDGAAVGAYDSSLLDQHFSSQPEQFYEWGESELEPDEHVRIYRGSIAPHEFALIPTFVDGTFDIVELTTGGVRSGVFLQRSESPDRESTVIADYRFVLKTDDVELEVWLAETYDDESIADSLIEALEWDVSESADAAYAEKFLAATRSIAFVRHVGEEASGIMQADGWAEADAGIDGFCKFVLRIMQAGTRSA